LNLSDKLKSFSWLVIAVAESSPSVPTADEEENEYIEDPTVAPRSTSVEVTPEAKETPRVEERPEPIIVEIKHRLPEDRSRWHLILPSEVRTWCERALSAHPGFWMASRDAAFMAMLQCYGRRSSENLMLKKSDIRFDKDYLWTNFPVLKKNKRPRQECVLCETKNGNRAKFCGKCGHSLQNSRLIFFKHTGEQPRREVRIKTSNPLTKYLIDWWNQIPEAENVVFPVSDIETGDAWRIGKPVWNHRLSKQAAPGILQRYVPDSECHIWPHLFRDSLATRMVRALVLAGKDYIGPTMAFFNWDDPKMPTYYAQQGAVGLANEVSDQMADLLDEGSK
jgi:integrase